MAEGYCGRESLRESPSFPADPRVHERAAKLCHALQEDWEVLQEGKRARETGKGLMANMTRLCGLCPQKSVDLQTDPGRTRAQDQESLPVDV